MKPRQPKDLTGVKWNRLEVVSFSGKNKHGSFLWKCQCSCGRCVILRATQINRRKQISCGCLTKEILSKKNTTYGEGQSRLAAVWRTMINRCHNPNNPLYWRYGGKGIYVCDQWKNSFLHFKSDMGNPPTEKHQLDRWPNKKGPYSPENVRWATVVENQRNRVDNVLETINGKTRLLCEWCELFGIKYGTMWKRYRLGWRGERLLTPVRKMDNSWRK